MTEEKPKRGRPRKDTVYLHVRIDPKLKTKADKLARSDGRTLNNWLVRLIEQTVEK